MEKEEEFYEWPEEEHPSEKMGLPRQTSSATPSRRGIEDKGIIIKKKSNENMVYMQIVDYIKRGIVRGDVGPGTKIMAIKKFAEHLDVADNTVWMAYARLVKEGLLRVKKGAGYFVTDNPSIIFDERRRLINQYTIKYAETLKECLPVVDIKRGRGIRESDVDEVLKRIKEIIFRKPSENG